MTLSVTFVLPGERRSEFSGADGIVLNACDFDRRSALTLIATGTAPVVLPLDAD